MIKKLVRRGHVMVASFKCSNQGILTHTIGHHRRMFQIKNILSTIKYAMPLSVVEWYWYITLGFLTQPESDVYPKRNGRVSMEATSKVFNLYKISPLKMH